MGTVFINDIINDMDKWTETIEAFDDVEYVQFDVIELDVTQETFNFFYNLCGDFNNDHTTFYLEGTTMCNPTEQAKQS